MTDKRRRLDKLGAGSPDPELRKLTDEELSAAYERELSGEAEAARQRELVARGPLGYLVDLPDDEYIPVMAIQAVDRERAVDAMDRVRGLLVRYRPDITSH